MDLAIYLLASPVVGSEQADEFLAFLLVDFYPDTRLSRNMDWDYVLRQDHIKENAGMDSTHLQRHPGTQPNTRM